MNGRKNAFIAIIAGILMGIFAIPILKNVFGNFTSLSYIVFPVAIGSITFFVYELSYKFRTAWILGPRIGKFIIVGGLNTVVDLFVLNILISITGIVGGALYAVFKGISFLIASTNSYVWNKWWTFEYSVRTSLREYFRFFIFTVIGAIINVVVAYLFVALFAFRYSNAVVPANIGALIATIVSLSWNFVSYHMFVFRTHEKSELQS